MLLSVIITKSVVLTELEDVTLIFYLVPGSWNFCLFVCLFFVFIYLFGALVATVSRLSVGKF